MDDPQQEGDLDFSRDEIDCQLLSPITEMDESSLIENFKEPDDSNITKVVPELNLDFTMNNPVDRSSEPETPPDVLRSRLNNLQTEFEELKEFTDLERQTLHFDCIPMDKVKSFEEQFTSLNEKVELLMQENADYKRKLEVEETERTKVELELRHTKDDQRGVIILINEMKQMIKEHLKDTSIDENDPSIPFLENNGEIVNVEPFMNSFKGLEELLNKILQEKKMFQVKAEDFQSEILELNKTIERINSETTVNKHNFMLAKSNCLHLQEQLENVDKELAEIKKLVSVSEDKLIEAERANDVINSEKCSIKSKMDDAQEQINSIFNTLGNFVRDLNCDSDIANISVINEDITELEKRLTSSHDLLGLSRAFAIIVEIIYKLKRELQSKYDQLLTIIKLNERLKEVEEIANGRKLEISSLEEEINHRIPCKLNELENCLVSQNSENRMLKSNLAEKNAKVYELLNKLSKAQTEIDDMKVLLQKDAFEKEILENDILTLKSRLTIEDVQTNMVFVLKYLLQLINSWDEKSNLEDLVNKIQGNEDIIKLGSLLMNVHTQTIFNEFVSKCKEKLLLHEENNLCSRFRQIKNELDQFEIENKKLRLEVNTLDNIVREVISNRVNDLEKLVCFTDDEKLTHDNKNYLHKEEKVNFPFISEGEKQNENIKLFETTNRDCEKIKKEINNLNKATKADESLVNNICNLNEIENLIATWNCSEKFKVSEFTHQLNDKLLNYFNQNQGSDCQVDVFRIVNKFELKLLEMFELNSQLLKNAQYLISCDEEYEKKQGKNKSNNEDLECKRYMFENNSSKDKHEKFWVEEINNIKKMMILEITCLDETVSAEALMSTSLENIFNKLMQIIMNKEQEIVSYCMPKQRNFEQEIEKLNNKLKSQNSWRVTIETENEKMNTELSTLKSVNNSLDHKVKALSHELNNKTLEIDIMKSNNLELVTENDSLISDLNSAKELNNKYRHSISCFEKQIDKLNEEVDLKSNVIKKLERKLTSFKEIEVSSSSVLPSNTKEDCTIVGVNKSYSSNNVVLGDERFKDRIEKVSDLNTPELSELLREEIAFIRNVLLNGENIVVLSDLLSRCNEKICLLKDVVQTIRNKALELELKHFNDLQSIQTTLEYSTKDTQDLKLSISKLYMDLVPDEFKSKQKEIIDERVFQCTVRSLQDELDQMKSECVSLINRSEVLGQSAEVGQNVVQKLREVFQTVVEENHNMNEIVHNLRKSIECEQEKMNHHKQIEDKISMENGQLRRKNFYLENEIGNLKLKIFQLKREIFSEIDIIFPDKTHDNEKIAYLNQVLKRYSEDQKVYENVTEDLRFFGYQCELMLSYIQTVEYKQYFVTQQKEHLEKEHTALKEQVISQNYEMNRFMNQLISKSPFAIKSWNGALDVLGKIFSEYKFLKETEVKLLNEDKRKQEKILQQQKELTSLSKRNSSLTFELTECEDSIRKLRSELRTARSRGQKMESPGVDFIAIKQEKVDVAVQTEVNCCHALQKKLLEQKDKIDSLSAKLTKYDQLQRNSVTSNPYNKQVSYLERSLDQAKQRIGSLHLELKQLQSYNHELVEALKVQKGYKEKLVEARKEIEKLKSDKRPCT